MVKLEAATSELSHWEKNLFYRCSFVQILMNLLDKKGLWILLFLKQIFYFKTKLECSFFFFFFKLHTQVEHNSMNFKSLTMQFSISITEVNHFITF